MIYLACILLGVVIGAVALILVLRWAFAESMGRFFGWCLVICFVCGVAHAQERRRTVEPSVFFQTIRSTLYATGPVGSDQFITAYFHPNYRIRTADNDESVNGFTPAKVFRVRRVESTVLGGPVRTMFCAVTMLAVQSLDYDQRIRIDRKRLPIQILDTDAIAFEWRPWYSISTSVDADGVKCVACDWRIETVAPRGFPVPNGSCL